MSIEEIRASKPYGANYYGGTKLVGYFRRDGFKWSIYINGEWWSDYKDCHDIYWFFGWRYRHRFINPNKDYKLNPL